MNTRTPLATFALALSLTLSNTAQVDAQDFTVISSNMYHSATDGFNYKTGAQHLGLFLTLPGIEAFYRHTIPANGYGIIGMQEVDDGAARSLQLDVAQHVDNAMGYGWVNRFQGLMSFQGGQYGNAMTTNATIAKTQYWTFAHDPANKAQYGKEPRGAIATKLDFAGKRLWFITVHLEAANAIAMRQVWQLMGKIKTLDPDFPVIVVGDFNIRNQAPTATKKPEKTYAHLKSVFDSPTSGFKDISLHLATAIVAPTTVTDGQLDYVFVYDPNNRLQVLSCSAQYVFSYPFIFSDHKAVVAKFRWN